MNWDQIEGQWRQLTGRLKSTWGKATDDDATNVAGKKRMLLGKLQSRYGVVKDGAERRLDSWMAKLWSPSAGAKKISVEKADKSS